MRVESAVMPEYKEYLRGQIFVNFNIETEITENGTKYIYEQLRFNPPMSDEALDKEVAKRKDELKVKVITPRQARLALHRAGLLDKVGSMLAADKEMELWWEYSLDIQRNNEMVIALGMQLGLTEAQLDQLFVDGSKL